jgi:HAD superfamily hydrolase (TIGR01509 family)
MSARAPRLPAAILFDNDGVLVDTEALYFRANREILATIGVTLDEAAYIELFLRSGRGAWHLAEALGHAEDAVRALRAARDRRYVELVSDAGAAVRMPRALEIVTALARHYRLAIVTSAEPEPFARTHAGTGLLPHFDVVLTRDCYQRSKPDPEPYLCAMERLGLEPAQCLVIEDSRRGLEAARAAGIACWVIPSGLTAGESFDGADAILPDLDAAAARLLGGSEPV